MGKKRVLFICSQNKLRSPTAEKVFSDMSGLILASAGLGYDAEVQVNADYVAGSDMIFVMEKGQEELLRKKFGKYLKNVEVVCLDIPDQYDYMDPELIKILWERVPEHLNKLKAS